MAAREEPRLSHGEELRMQHLFDGDELEEFIYTLRCKLLTRRRRCVTTRERLPHGSNSEPFRTVVPHLGPWLDGAASVASLARSARLGQQDVDALWISFFCAGRWRVARSPLGRGWEGPAVLAILPADVRAALRERGAGATLVGATLALERARRAALLRRGWEGHLDRHFLGNVPRPHAGWERRRWRVFRDRGGAWLIEAYSLEGRRVWSHRLQGDETVEPYDARDGEQLNDDLRCRGVWNLIDFSDPGGGHHNAPLFTVLRLDLPLLLRATSRADMDEFAELFSSIGADRAARTCAKASDDAAARWPAPWMVVAVAACLAVARPYPRLLADVLS